MIDLVLGALGPWRSPALAFAVALAAAALLRPWPALTGLAAALGLVAGLFDVFGMMVVTPRMLPERLPWLALAAALAGAALQAARPGMRWRAGALVAAALAGAWWLLGAPRAAGDLAQVALLLPGVAAFLALALAPWRREGGMRPGVRAALAAVLLGLGLALAGAPALFSGLAATVAAAAIGALIGAAGRAGAGTGEAGLLPLAAATAGTAVVASLAWPGGLVLAAGGVSLLVLVLPWSRHPNQRDG